MTDTRCQPDGLRPIPTSARGAAAPLATTVNTPRWIYAVLGVGLFLVVVPFLWMLVSSFKPEARGARACRPPGGPRR